MRPPLRCLGVLGAALLAACADDPPPPVVAPPPIAEIVRADEGHLTEVRQLTFGGENGAGRWAWAMFANTAGVSPRATVEVQLLLLAIAQLRLGTPAQAGRDHVVILETSAWMGARSGNRTFS